MEQRDIVGFPNGSMLLRDIQPKDSGTYHVEVHINPSWTMRAKTEVQVPGECWGWGRKWEGSCTLHSYHILGPVQTLLLFNTYGLSTSCVPGSEGIYSPSALADKISIE